VGEPHFGFSCGTVSPHDAVERHHLIRGDPSEVERVKHSVHSGEGSPRFREGVGVTYAAGDI